MKKQSILPIIVFAAMLPLNITAKDLTEYIDTRVGTAPSQSVTASVFGKKTEVLGQTIPAVLAPNGMNFWTPQTRDTELKCVAPYYYDDNKLQGFRNSHWIIGGCTQDYGSMTLMPLFGELRCLPETRATTFSHNQEVALPDYYSIILPDEGIKAEMTATSRCAIFQFTYDKAGKAYIVVNPNSDEGEGFIAVDPVNNLIYGYNPVHRIYQSKGESAGFSGHFVVEFNNKITGYGCYSGDIPMPGVKHISKKAGIGAYVEFDVKAGEQVLVKAASSFTGYEGAMVNLEIEIPDWDFNEIRDALKEQWAARLGSIELESDNETDIRKFYGSMYRASFLPHEVSDVDGLYVPFASGYPTAKLEKYGARYFDDFSMWDTYRALHPFITLMFPSLSGEMMQSLVYKYEQGEWLPIFPCWNSYTSAMIGDHCIAAMADAYVKGVTNFDIDKAYEAMRKNAMEMPSPLEYADGKGRRALDSYLKYNYIPIEDTVPNAYHKQEQASRTLEYCFDDFALAQVALSLDQTADYDNLIDRAKNYTYAINPSSGYADGRFANGTFCFDTPFEFSKHFTEGAPCHYTWYVPHDVYGLMEIMGGKDMYVSRLDAMFDKNRYWHGNEPCHQIPFMFNYAGQPWKTSKAVRNIMETEYFDSPGGLSGNEDAGQMSAWYIFAALGFYPVCPATPHYIISGPAFKSATLHLENGKDLIIKAPNASKDNIYIQSVTHNGQPYTKNYLYHWDLMKGGVWEFEMGDKPNKKWGINDTDCPPKNYNLTKTKKLVR